MFYLFGDSFTEGIGLIKEDDNSLNIYSLTTFDYTDFIWPNFLSKYTGEGVVNLGEGGASNHYIRESILKSVNSFSKGDTIIIGMTKSTRLSFPYYNKVKEDYRYIHVGPHSIDWVERRNKIGVKKWVDIDYSHMNVILNYYTETISRCEDYIYNRDIELLDGLVSLLNSVGCRCIVWEDFLWGETEGIADWTFGRLENYHWSPNGHKFFSTVLIYALENNISHIDLNAFKQMLPYLDPEFKRTDYIDFKTTV